MKSARTRKKAAGKKTTKRATKKAAAKRAPRKKSATGKKAVTRKGATKPRRRRAKPQPLRYGAGPPITDAASLAAALAGLKLRDPEGIAHLLEIGGEPPLRLRAPGFAGLAAIVISQQVSVASANAIGGRLTAAFDPLDESAIDAASEESLRACGLSGAKVRTLKAIAAAILSGVIDFAALAAMPAPDAHAALCAVHGIGPWTADIFLLFCLGHPDAWPAGDIALQEAAKIALKLRTRPDAAKLTRIGERWRPHRGVAARLLWAYYRAVKTRAGIGVA